MKLRSGKQSYSHKYYNPSEVGSYSGLNAFKLKNVSKNKTARYLSTQDVYTLHKPIVRRFQRRKVICYGKFVTLEIDLIDLKNFSHSNSGNKYILTAICCFSRFGFAQPLRSKHAHSAISGLKKILQETKNRTKFISCDQGSEFISNSMKSFLDSKNIKLYHSYNKTIKAALVERFNRTLQTRLYKYMYANKTKKYIHILQDIVNSYNKTFHSSIGMSPENVDATNSETVWNKLYPFRYRKKHKFYIGETVRIPSKHTIFTRGYTPNWQEDIHTVVDIHNTTPYTYSLLNTSGNKVRKKYYEQEMVRVRYE